MEKNLDKSINEPVADEQIVKVGESSYVDETLAIETEDEVVDEEVVSDDDSDNDEEMLASTDDDVVEEDTTHEGKKQSKPLSKEESKIVALKRQNQKLLEDYRALHDKLEEVENIKKQSQLKSQYVDQGMDEEQAEKQASKDVLLDKQNARLELLEFKYDNDDVLRNYPESKKDLARIMTNVKATGMTVEQVCRGLYGLGEPTRETRAKKAATGEIEEDMSTPSVASAQRASTSTATVALSKRDLEAKRDFETRWRDGEKMTNAEFIEIKKKYRL